VPTNKTIKVKDVKDVLIGFHFKQIAGCGAMYQVLIKPLKIEALKKLIEDGRVSINILIPLGHLVGFGEVDAMNDYADEHILDSSVVGSLADLSYKIIGCAKGGDGNAWLSGQAIINVNADVSDIL
jgi:hypothetical protein